VIASNILQSLSTTVGNIYYGQMLGVSALAAASALFPLLVFLLSFLIGLSSAAAVLVGQAFGAGDFARARRVTGTTLTVCVLAGVVVAGLCNGFAREILKALGTPDDILGDTLVYARVTFVILPVTFLRVAYTIVLRGVSDTRSALYALLISTAISLILTPALIRGWAGLPPLGVVSGPCAALVATVTSLGWLFLHLVRTGSPLAPSGQLVAALRPNAAILSQLFQIGVPGGIQNVLGSLSELAIIDFVNVFGSSATAAYGAVGQIFSYVRFPVISIGSAASVFVAQAIGGANTQRLQQISRTAIWLSVVVGGGVVALLYLCAGPVVGWFIRGPETADLARRLVNITLWGNVFFGVSQVLQGVMRGSGVVLWPTALSLLAIWFIQVPVAYFLSHQIGIDGVLIAYPVTNIGGLILQAIYYIGVWRKRSHAEISQRLFPRAQTR
jgi:putative MATE family efflux protein